MYLVPADPTENLLPCYGVVNYHGSVFTPEESERHLARLIAEIPWEHDETVMFGKRIVTKRSSTGSISSRNRRKFPRRG